MASIVSQAYCTGGTFSVVLWITSNHLKIPGRQFDVVRMLLSIHRLCNIRKPLTTVD